MNFANNEVFKIEHNGEIYKTRKSFLKINHEKNLKVLIHNSFEKLDWSKEPNKPLRQFFKERAEQIRDCYDYLILYFSGGSDSMTALNAFLNNNIELEEVVINCYPQIEADVLNCEYAKNYLKKRMYRGKITVNEITLKKLNYINRNHIWTDNENFTGLFHNYLRFDVDFFEQSDVLKYQKRKGNVAHIFGFDYPSIAKIEDKFYCIMNPYLLSLPPYSPKSVNFFTSPEMPELHLKQCHILAKYMKENDVYAEEKCKICIRDEFNPKMFAPKTSGMLKKQFFNGSESSWILNTYFKDEEFKDIYANIIYKEVIKPRLNSTQNIFISKKYLLF